MRLCQTPTTSSAGSKPMPAVHYGIEFEYLLVDTRGPQAGRLRDIHALDVPRLAELLADKPGLGDPELAEGDLGIRNGYWYLEGDERFDLEGRLVGFVAKGVEIRTPPRPSVAVAIDCLLDIERQLAARLERDGLGLAIAGFDPLRTRYGYQPPLNAFERRLRAGDREYEGMELSMLTYGPDLNLSLPDWSTRRNLDAARKLNYYAPYIVPFSFSSPYCAGQPWHGWSRRTWLRCEQRPAVKLFLGLEEYAEQAERSPLLRPARLAREAGRIEFKAFDAMPSVELLAACCHLLTGICLANNLRGRSETPDVALYRRAALHAFDDAEIRNGARAALYAAAEALDRAGNETAVAGLAPLARLLSSRSTPAHDLLANDRLFHPGGLADTLPRAAAC
ncbi:glutamate-cysteine ligase-like protein [Azotobacter vinelandii CA]|uniref:Glutamate-cysteine ligase-like protein n=3 Tax=Azotobacter group TaxID=351 RepID=C1DH93_AZOVD|nr:glutamate-cysteine ligase-like protein [Azotobacter vinelandii DJ]AGK17376.1 glutamate-cysteine ligase-like protein [Azotobacter vinelandii CA]AGK19170.1 glutamate-cysteine ligase-like protein [Azotobacter vinelandii CA6]SFX09434.1 Glutamate-cysteine ligase family 2(GCS2) [Azotobacter vinelandii]